MADLTSMGLDPEVEENSGGFEVLPGGKYKMVVVADRVVPTKDNTGKLLEVKLQVVEGQHAGSGMVDRINIINKSPIAQKIGQGQLKRLCNLTGCPYPPSDTTRMYGKPILVTVKIEEFTSNTTGATLKSNKVAGYNPVSDVAPPVAGQKTASTW